MPTSLDTPSLIGALHGGVTDDDAWSEAISGICAIVGVSKLLMGRIGAGGRSLELTFAHQANLVQAALLTGPLATPHHNPWLTLAQTHPLRRVASVGDLGGKALLESTAVWRDFYLPFGLGDTIGAALERQPEQTDIVVMARQIGQADFEKSTVRRFSRLLPHLARAWRVRRTLSEMRRSIGTLTHILDRMERAVVVAGPTGDIRFANAAADRLLSSGGAIGARNGRLRAVRHDQTVALHKLIETAARTGVGEAGTAVDALGLASENDPIAVAVVAEPLAPAHAAAIGCASDNAALLFLGCADAATRPHPERLRAVYGLTRAEARLAALLADGDDLNGVAVRLGVSRNTVKFHTRAVFEKVGVSRHAELVRRLLADVGGVAEQDGAVDSVRSNAAGRAPTDRDG